MTSEQIQCFFAVVESGSFTAAAETMYMTQPALSKRIAALEQEVALTLFSRDKTKRTELTMAGKVFYDGLKEVYQSFEMVLANARNMEAGIAGTIRLGLFENQIIDEYLQEILNDFSRHYPNIELYVTTATFEQLIEQIHNGTLDCGITLGYDLVGRTKLKSKVLYALKTYLVVPNQFLDEAWKVYTIEDFFDMPFLTIRKNSNNFYQREVSSFAKSHGFTPKLIQASDDKNFMMLLEMGKGVAFLDSYSKCCNSPNVRCFSFPEIPDTPFSLVWSEKSKNPALNYLLEYLNVDEKRE
ncbi:MAG: LysR family transcriptional regulator [Eubacterium sp.]|nr:LysR family transcriptional regulator [Eubacterium sp.]